MGLFKSSIFDQDIERATNEKNTSENWALIMDICDKISTVPNGSKEAIKSIVKRMHHQIPNVSMQVMDACVSNCGKPFHLEIASRDMEQEIRKIINKGHPKVVSRMKELLKKWASNEFKNDPQLSMIPSLYNNIKKDKPDDSLESTSSERDITRNKEEEDIAKAIRLSLQEVENSSTKNIYESIHHTLNSEIKKVQALYDFEAAEDNELTFFAGEIIHVLDDTDPNWWKGTNQRGEGLFPANFVTSDLLELSQSKYISLSFYIIKKYIAKQKTMKHNNESADSIKEVKAMDGLQESESIKIDERKIDKMIHLLHEADSTGEHEDTFELINLEKEVHAMGPLIDQKLQQIDSRHAQLSQLNTELQDALNMYHNLMKDAASVPTSYFQTDANYMHHPTTSQSSFGPVFNPSSHMSNVASTWNVVPPGTVSYAYPNVVPSQYTAQTQMMPPFLSYHNQIFRPMNESPSLTTVINDPSPTMYFPAVQSQRPPIL